MRTNTVHTVPAKWRRSDSQDHFLRPRGGGGVASRSAGEARTTEHSTAGQLQHSTRPQGGLVWSGLIWSESGRRLSCLTQKKRRKPKKAFSAREIGMLALTVHRRDRPTQAIRPLLRLLLPGCGRSFFRGVLDRQQDTKKRTRKTKIQQRRREASSEAK